MSPWIRIIVFTAMLTVACSVQKKANYVLPEAMLPHVKIEYAKTCNKGYALYNIACAKCHTTNKGRREVIPDFSPEQLRGYALRIANAQHETNMPDSLVSEEELGLIMVFLTYKKKQNKLNQ